MAERRFDKSHDEDFHCEEIDHKELEIVQVSLRVNKREPVRVKLSFVAVFTADRKGKFWFSLPSDLERECCSGEGVVRSAGQWAACRGETQGFWVNYLRFYCEISLGSISQPSSSQKHRPALCDFNERANDLFSHGIR